MADHLFYTICLILQYSIAGARLHHLWYEWSHGVNLGVCALTRLENYSTSSKSFSEERNPLLGKKYMNIGQNKLYIFLFMTYNKARNLGTLWKTSVLLPLIWLQHHLVTEYFKTAIWRHWKPIHLGEEHLKHTPEGCGNIVWFIPSDSQAREFLDPEV